MPIQTGHISTRPTTSDKVEVLEEHAHSPSLCYPTLADPIAVAAAAGIWTLGSFVEIIPAGTTDKDFDIHFVSVEDLSSVDKYQIHLFVEEEFIGKVRVVRAAQQDSTTQVPIQTLILKAGSQVQAKVACASGSNTATISLHYHEY
jgi:hypothetical protein